MILTTQPSLSTMMVMINPPYKLELSVVSFIIGGVSVAKKKKKKTLIKRPPIPTFFQFLKCDNLKGVVPLFSLHNTVCNFREK